MNENGLPPAPEGYRWKIRRWNQWDYEVLPYPRFGKLNVALVTSHDWERHHARALMSPRSIRAAALRVLARHRREVARQERASFKAASPRSVQRAQNRKARETAREAKREAQVAGYAGTYPPKKMGW